MKKEYESIRTFAKQYLEIANSDDQNEKRELWRKHNSFIRTRPLTYIRYIPYGEFFDYSVVKSTNPILREVENMLATSVLYRVKLNDDFIFNPWVSIRAVYAHPEEERWGIPCTLGERPQPGGAAAYQKFMEDESDLPRLKSYPYEIDEVKTKERYEMVYDAIGDIIDIHVDKRGAYSRTWNMDLCTNMAYMLSLESLMYDLYDKPEFLHKMLTFMRDAVLADIDAYEKSGNITLADSDNQAMPFAMDLPTPDCNVKNCKAKDIWAHIASQEFTGVGPDLYSEFLLEYQKPIIAKYGLVSYGCCENLTQKIPLLKGIPNIRRMAVSPFSNVKKCAEEIQDEFILAWRPNPSSMIATGLDEDFVRKTMRTNFDIFKQNNNSFDITLKDIETIHHSPEDLIRWSRIVKEEIANNF